ncbi:hypothetical protein HPULCUR_008657 [Helicostylum pulchrum]|uniref:Methyltransferase domain-containing protein n=1 Tax=Helicostylum pulchrum TaxID=562976 RepID=A0ABP9Y887_9FUNG
MVTPVLENKTSEEYYYEDGRRFNSSVGYPLPSDEKAPVKQQLEKGIPVLDSACGNGAPWTIDMAKEYPNSQFFGVDISDGFPSKGRAPINTSFSIGNVTIEIPSPDNTFVFAYQKMVFGALTSEEWDSVMEQGFKSKNLVLHISTELKDRLENAGFINCVTKITEYPVNHGTNGDSNWRVLRGAFESGSPLLSKFFAGGYEREKYDRFLDAVGDEVAEYKSYVKFYTVHAQKPCIDQQK